LKKIGLKSEKNKSLDVIYDDKIVGQIKVDFVINKKVIVQIYNDKIIDPFNQQKHYNQLRASGLNVGIILNFKLTHQFKRKEII
jgi:GxxExxY protein